MDYFQRTWNSIRGKAPAPYIDEAPKEDEDKVTTKDLLRFMEKQQESNTALISAILATSNAQAQTMQTYIDLFKPREVKSSTLDEREFAKQDQVKPRDSEWEGIETAQDFHMFTAGPGIGIPPDLPD